MQRERAATLSDLENEVVFQFRNRWKMADVFARCEIQPANIDHAPPGDLALFVVTRKLLNVDLSQGITACLPGIRRTADLIIQELAAMPVKMAKVKAQAENQASMIPRLFRASDWVRYGIWKPKVILLEREDGLYLSVRFRDVGIFRRRGRCAAR